MSVISYFDESGDDGIKNCSSSTFILTATYMNIDNWNINYEAVKKFRNYLKQTYRIPIKEEFHTAKFFTDKNPYRMYNLTKEDKLNIVKLYAKLISCLNLKIINTIIDKNNIVNDNYPILFNALTYTIQRIENDSSWKYLIISDKGRVSIMRKTARAIRAYNPITSIYGNNYYNLPIKNMIEDILEKDSKKSYFIQISYFVSYIVNLYYKYCVYNDELSKRIESWLSKKDIVSIMKLLKKSFNTSASSSNEYGLVIYPKFMQKKDTTLPSFKDGVVQ